MSDPIIPLRPTTTFHKLLFAERHVKELKIEVGKLNAYITELEDYRKKHQGVDPAWTDEEKKFIRRDEQVLRLRDRNKNLMKLNKTLKRTNSTLISRLYANERTTD